MEKIIGEKLTRNEMKNLLLDNLCPDGSDGIGPCATGCPVGFYCVAGSNGALECCVI